MLSVKKKDLKKKGHGNKPNASEPLEDHQIEQMWSSGAIGLQIPRSLLRLVWWNNVTHLEMRAFKEQYDCQIDFTVSEEYVEYKERQTKNRHHFRRHFHSFCSFLLSCFLLLISAFEFFPLFSLPFLAYPLPFSCLPLAFPCSHQLPPAAQCQLTPP